MSATPFGVGNLSSYTNLEQVGEGAYGYVFRARDTKNNNWVALKRLIIHKENSGFPLSAVREIKFLKSLQHKNIVQLREVAIAKGCENKEVEVQAKSSSSANEISNSAQNSSTSESDNPSVARICGNLYFVFEFVENDLGGLLEVKYNFSEIEVKSIAKQLLEALLYLHDRKIVHRDIKPSNILISNRHQVKLADFGMARTFKSFDGRDQRINMSNNVITLWYRPPELLLGSVRYSTAVDIWSTGCVIAELLLGRPLFAAKTETETIELIFKLIGTPSLTSWQDITELPLYDTLVKRAPAQVNSFRSRHLAKLGEISITFLERMLTANPMGRLSARAALEQWYFTSKPIAPEDPSELPSLETGKSSCHEFLMRQQRKKRMAEENDSLQLSKQSRASSFT